MNSLLQELENKRLDVFFYRSFLFLSYVLLVGAACNSVVMIENQGKMPVQSYNMIFSDERHFTYVYSYEVKYAFLSDIVDIGPIGIVSIGDILMVASWCLMVVIGTVFLTKKFKLDKKYGGRLNVK